MKTLSALSLAAVLVAATGPVLAQSEPQSTRDPFYCDERKLGTWFYCNSEEAKRKARERAKQQQQPQPQAVPAVERMAAITKQLDELKALAVLEPTSENVVNYIRFQREQLDRASTFADVWGRAIWQTPELDYTLERPVSTLAKQTWLEDRKSQREGSMAALSERYGLFYFYSSSCSACRTFSPVIRALSDNYGLEVLAVSMDGGPNEAFPNYVVDSGQYQRMGLQGSAVPALVLFDTATKQPIPIGYGVMAADEVMQRIFYLTQIEPGSDY
ncbi:MAG: conjugal transfer protein TraF [Verrucomicrobiales bacterium]|jgi:conjugal transfer pilus assembly protein TraF|nr:conjugal transfer protein TraF [Verrucomicrobiales bacterium]|tara:strand:- start:1562 stop:2377 length:816 start_codon:yes stop_codon:yes gene_type:complete